MARGSGNELARIHALWTLEGLDLLTPAQVREALRDEEAPVRVAAIRASETLIKKGETNLLAERAGHGRRSRRAGGRFRRC